MSTKFAVTYEGQTFTRTSKTRTYTHVVIARRTDLDELFAFRWSGSEVNALKGAKECRGLVEVVAVVPCAPEGQKQPETVEAEHAPAGLGIDGPTLAQRAGVRYCLVGSGRRVHYSNNDDTLCGREVTEYTDGLDDRHRELCARCINAAEKRTRARELAAVEAKSVTKPEQAQRDEPSDTWTITTRAGDEIARVHGATAEDMTRAAEALPAVQANMRREGGFARRRLYTSELTPAASEPAAEQDVVEGVVVEHAGTAEGSLPQDATHPDVVAAREALAGLAAATLTDRHDFSEPQDDERNVRGYVVNPRGQGRVALYWLEGGRNVRRDEMPHGPALDCLADRMTRRGWTVEKMLRSSLCVFAHRPAEGATLAPVEPTPDTLVDPWTRLRHPVSSYDTRTTAPAAAEALACRHHVTPRADVSGDPIKACDRKQPNQEAGIFSDEGCVEAYDCAVQAANRAAEMNAEGDSPADDPLYGWDLMCPEHREQQVDACEECATDIEADAVAELPAVADVEQDVVDEPEAAGTWRSGWIASAPAPIGEALFDLGEDVEQGALFE